MTFLQALRPISITFIALLLYMPLMEFKYDKKKAQGLMASTVGFIAVVAIVVIWLFGISTFMQFYLLLVNVPAVIASILTSKYNPGRVIFTLLVVWYLALIVLFPAAGFFMFVGDNIALELLFRVLVFIPVYVFVRQKVAPIYRHVLQKLDSGWWLLSLLPLVGILAIQSNVIDLNNPSMDSFFRAVVVFILMTLLYISYYTLFKRMGAIYERESLAQSIELQLRLQQERFSLLEKKVETSRRFDHDLRHYLLVLSQFITNGQHEEALAYIGSIHDAAQRRQGEIVARYCENHTVDVLLRYYLENAQEKGVEVSTDIVLPAKSLWMRWNWAYCWPMRWKMR